MTDLLANLQLERLHREQARRGVLAYTHWCWQQNGMVYNENWHHALIARYLDLIEIGRIDRLMIFAPPRAGKTQLVGKEFPSYHLGRHPDHYFVGASYNQDLARVSSKMVRRRLRSPAHRILFPACQVGSSHAGYVDTVDEFELLAGGSYRGIGVGGGLIGRGFHIAAVDDPIKGREAAYSEVIRQSTWDWWGVDFMSRQQDGFAPIALMHQRWHEDDVAGRELLHVEEVDGRRWFVLDLPAIAEPSRSPLPGVSDQHPDDPREPGEALWPGGGYTIDFLEDMRARSPREFAAMYQQRPTPAGGDMFKRDWFRYYRLTGPPESPMLQTLNEADGRPVPPPMAIMSKAVVRFATVDLAASTKQHADWTVIAVWALVTGKRPQLNPQTGETSDVPVRHLVLLDVVRRRMEAPDLIPALKQVRQRWKLSLIAIEKVGMQLALVQLAKNAGLPVREIEPDRDKVARAMPASIAYEAGEVHHPAQASWLDTWEHEFLSFPNGTHDDQVDTGSMGVHVRDWFGVGPNLPPTVKPNPVDQWDGQRLQHPSRND